MKKLSVEEILHFLESLWTGFSVRQFDVRQIRPNLQLLIGLSPKDWLYAGRCGKLSKIEGMGARCWYLVRNLVRFNGLSHRLFQALQSTLITYFYEIRSPIDAEKIFVIQRRKAAIVKKALVHLNTVGLHKRRLALLEKEVDDYTRRVYVQERIIQNALKATQGAKKCRIVEDVKKALSEGIRPSLSIRGFSGTYLMRGTNYLRVGVFKPFDEEIGAPNNPASAGSSKEMLAKRDVLGSRAVREGVRSGESLHREVAASLVDEYLGLEVVPKTIYASFSIPSFKRVHPFERKRGSFQKYVEGGKSLSQIEVSAFEKIPISTFQALFTLDLLIGHLDRHLSNILFDGSRLIAIDNALSFPDRCQSLEWLEWKKFPQSMVPWTNEWQTRIEKIEWQPLKEYLTRKSYLSIDSLELMHARLSLLQAGVQARLTPAKIVELMIKENFTKLKDYDAYSQKVASQIVDGTSLGNQYVK